MGHVGAVADIEDQHIIGLAGAAAPPQAQFIEPESGASTDAHQRAREARDRLRRDASHRRYGAALRALAPGATSMTRPSCIRAALSETIASSASAQAAPRLSISAGSPLRERGRERRDRHARGHGARKFRRKDAIDENEARRRQARGLRAEPGDLLRRPARARAAAPGASDCADRYNARPRCGDSAGPRGRRRRRHAARCFSHGGIAGQRGLGRAECLGQRGFRRRVVGVT